MFSILITSAIASLNYPVLLIAVHTVTPHWIITLHNNEAAAQRKL